MSFGSSPKPPAAQPQTPVPQDDDPKSFDTRRKAAIDAQGREGYSAHLLTGGRGSTSTDTSSSPSSEDDATMRRGRAATLG